MGKKQLNASYWIMLNHAEAEIISSAVETVGGNVQRAAAVLGVTMGFLYKRIKELGIGGLVRARKPDGSASEPAAPSSPPESSDEEGPAPNNVFAIARSDHGSGEP